MRRPKAAEKAVGRASPYSLPFDSRTAALHASPNLILDYHHQTFGKFSNDVFVKITTLRDK